MTSNKVAIVVMVKIKDAQSLMEAIEKWKAEKNE